MYDICIFRTERDEKREGRRVTRPVKISKMFRPLFTSSPPRYAVVGVHFFDRARKKSRPFAFCSFLRSIMPVSRHIPGCSVFDWCLFFFICFFSKASCSAFGNGKSGWTRGIIRELVEIEAGLLFGANKREFKLLEQLLRMAGIRVYYFGTKGGNWYIRADWVASV